MSVFASIMSRIFGRRAAAVADLAAKPAVEPAATAASAAPAPPVDVAAILDALQAKAGQALDWRHSIVDLMKLLGLDSSLPVRSDLAQELGYTGSIDDSAPMNLWLHRKVMTKLAENGGKVPDELKG